jgi:CheY-like chemotaxis protein
MSRVLIVEDEWLQAENVETLLAPNGHTVCGTTTDGEEAVAIAVAQRPDVVVMDVQLPGALDGIAAATRIRSERPCAIVFLTAYDDAESMRRMRRVEPVAILTKPADGKAILAAVNRAAGRPG